jgi:hypothetical protein
LSCSRQSPARYYRPWMVLLVALVLFSPLAVSTHEARAQDESSTPQLPVLLLNGAVYAQEYDAGDLPESFRVDGYPSRQVALCLVQCEDAIKEVWVEDLRRIGAEPRGYLPYNTLLVGMDEGVRSRLEELDFVTWHGLYQPYFKISPALQLRLSQGGEVTVLAEVFSARYLEQTLEALQELPVEVIGTGSDAWCSVIALRMAVEETSRVASLPAVEWMELCASGTLPATLAGGPGGSITTETSPQVNVDGSELVALMDTGLGSGGLQGLMAPLAGRVVALYSLRGDSGADANGHGTAVAGSMLDLVADETAPIASSRLSILAYATGYGLGCPPQPLSLYSLLDDAYGQGVRIFLSGSVPESKESLGAYGIYALLRDAFIWNNPTMMVVEAAGNEGTDSEGNGSVDKGSLLGGATAKNVLSVGGCESATAAQGCGQPLTYLELDGAFSGRFPAAPLREDSSVGTPTGMAAFSSRGPTRDGRIKPDLVAPSTCILTLYPGGATAPNIFATAAQGYAQAYGTSMAAAEVAAALASMRLPLAGVQEREPSAALLKAFLVNGAKDLAPGQYGEQAAEIPPAPNAVEGWGSLDLEAFSQTVSWAKVLDDKEGMRLGESRVFRVEVTSGRELRITLAWSDYPSLPQARLHLVNDLDLRLIGPDGNVYYPNARNSRDPLNNVERVVIDIEGKPGDYTIELSAWNVPFSPQPFALVAQVF